MIWGGEWTFASIFSKGGQTLGVGREMRARRWEILVVTGIET